MTTPIEIAVEGVIGVGKTTLAQALARHLGAVGLWEDALSNPFLADFYREPERWGLACQLHFLVARLAQFARPLEALGVSWAQPLSARPHPPPRQQRIERFIERRYAEPVRLADLAHHLALGVERCRHVHVVVETCDTGFAALLKQTCIRAACALLLNTGLSVAEVGERCGLADPSGFNRAFRAVMDASPGNWRARNHA